MAKEGEIYLGVDSDEDLISTYAKEVVREFEEFGRSERTFGGTLKTDITSRKYKFIIQYEYIDQTALSLVYEKYNLDEGLNLRMYITDSTWFTNFDSNCPVVRIAPFKSTDFLTGRSTKIYKGDSIVFVEI
jgi:hypothetical protein